jgi:uncharacterized MAPEG superfamily protein
VLAKNLLVAPIIIEKGPTKVFDTFRQVTDSDVRKLLSNSKMKSCLIDPAPTLGDRLLCESASRASRASHASRASRASHASHASFASRASHASHASLRVFHCFSSLNAFYSMLVYKLSNNISLIHNPYISISSLISDSLYLLILKYISVLSAVFIEIFQHNQQYDTLLPISPARIN